MDRKKFIESIAGSSFGLMSGIPFINQTSSDSEKVKIIDSGKKEMITTFQISQVVPTVPQPTFVPAEQVTIANVSSAQDFHMGWIYDAEHAVDGRPETDGRH